VLFEAPRREITSVAVGANGTIYAASVGDKSHNPLPPLPVQGVGTVTITVVQPGSLQAANTSTSVPEGSEIYALTEGQAPRKLWSGKDEIVYALAARPTACWRSPAIAATSSGSPTTAATPTWPTSMRSRAEPGRVRQRGAGRHPHRHRQHRQAGFASAQSEKARVRQRCAGCRRAGPLWPHRSRARLTGYELSPAPATWSSRCAAGPTGSRSRTAQVASPAGRFLQWKAVLHAGARGQRGRELPARQRRAGGGRSGGGPGRAHQSRSPESARPRQPPITIAFPSSSQNAAHHLRRRRACPCRPSKTAPPSPSAGPPTTTTATT
jgi:hypothetical protein